MLKTNKVLASAPDL